MTGLSEELPATTATTTAPRGPARAGRSGHRRVGRALTATALAALALGNAVAIVVLWWRGGNVTDVASAGEVLTSIARITGYLGAYLALLEVVLLARVPPLERLVGFDRLTVWHRWNGFLCVTLVVAHVFFSIWGYAELDGFSLLEETRTMIVGGIYPGMVTATIGTVLFVAVAGASAGFARRRLRYEAWYALHLGTYLAIALAWFHQIPTSNELVLNPFAAWWWRALFLGTLAVVVGFRVGVPLWNALRFRMRVARVERLADDVVSVEIEGRGLERLDARGGQFLLWRFLDRRRWWASHPFSLSAEPTPERLRITVKALGDFTGALATLRPGTRAIAEGPFGVFTADARRGEGALLVGGGIGIAPIRALLEELHDDAVVVYRVQRSDDLVLLDELEALASGRGLELHVVVGDHDDPAHRDLLSAEHLRGLVPDIARRDVFVCGPGPMTDAVVRSARRAGVPRSRIHAERFVL